MSALLLLMGVGLVAFGSFDSDSDAEAEPEDERPVTNLTDGDDNLVLEAADQIEGGQIVNAGAGNDELRTTDDIFDIRLNGQDGDDALVFGNNAVADGGAGNDFLFARGPDAVGFGGAGDDTLQISFDGEGTVNGGYGDDILRMSSGFGQLNGDAGDDRFTVTGQGRADGGAGDDLFPVVPNIGATAEELATHGPLELTGGAGEDVFGIRGILNLSQSGTVAEAVTITDYTLGEDLLAFEIPRGADPLNDIQVRVTQDEGAQVTLVELFDRGTRVGAAALEDMPDVQVEDIGLVTHNTGFEDVGPGENFSEVIGTSGDDTINGQAGDTIIGGSGDDVLGIADTNTLPSSITGGLGDDVITAAGDGVFRADAGEGNDTITIEAGGEFYVGGGEGDDVLTVTGEQTKGTYHVYGGEGNDTITVGNAESGGVFVGDGDNVANVGEGILVGLSGDGANMVNVTLSSAPADFITLEGFRGG